ncbi:DUF58 domain-containing protein [Estrella lausannensis]|uniref:DUF58 domain-containing protein n=1 Tax=Estrella lausannensis TaxID=483423 RepID=A0A0H5DNL1_9BACT|nr:DUF58 domain-containing protein [Estrella lausannensis]CRX37946.1 conserved hypothetical protein [Estrella lausannensis]
MLYPDFDELISYKDRKLDKMELSRRKVSSTTAGNHHSPFRGNGLDFDSVREYVPGDDIRNIDWRVTARTGSPHLKLFREEKERHTIISVDMNATMRFGTRNTFKSIQAAKCASLLGWRALAHQDRVSACFFGDVQGGLHYFSSKRSQKALCMMLKTLTEPPAEQHQIPLESALQHIARAAHPGSLIYLISDFMDLSPSFQTDSGLSRLCKTCDIVFISINDIADKALASAGVIAFCGQGGEKMYVNTDSIKGRKSYAALWDENRQALDTITKRFKIPLIAFSTESDIPRELPLSLKKIAKRKK